MAFEADEEFHIMFIRRDAATEVTEQTIKPNKNNKSAALKASKSDSPTPRSVEISNYPGLSA